MRLLCAAFSVAMVVESFLNLFLRSWFYFIPSFLMNPSHTLTISPCSAISHQRSFPLHVILFTCNLFLSDFDLSVPLYMSPFWCYCDPFSVFRSLFISCLFSYSPPLTILIFPPHPTFFNSGIFIIYHLASSCIISCTPISLPNFDCTSLTRAAKQTTAS